MSELSPEWKSLIEQVLCARKRPPGRKHKHAPISSYSILTGAMATLEGSAEAGLRGNSEKHLDFLMRKTRLREDPKQSKQLWLALPIHVWDSLEETQRSSGLIVSEQLADAVTTLALFLTTVNLGDGIRYLADQKDRTRGRDAAFRREERRIRINASVQVWQILEQYADAVDQPLGILLGRLLSGAVIVSDTVINTQIDRRYGEDSWHDEDPLSSAMEVSHEVVEEEVPE